MSHSRKWSLAAPLAIAAIAFAAPGFALADDAPDRAAAAAAEGIVTPVCGDPDVNTLSAADCTGATPVPSLDPADAADPPTVRTLAAATAVRMAAAPSPAELPAMCREHADIVFYTSTDWLRLAQKLAADASPCADYYISIPPLAADKTKLRCAQDDLVRALGPRIHPVAEFNFAGWNAWRVANRVTLGDAARLFVSRMRDCGYDFSLGETWSLNEVHSGVRKNLGVSRDNMRLLLNTLRAETGLEGIAFVIGFGQHTINVSDYKPQLEEWYQDAAYWEDMQRDVSVWAQEVFPDMRFWGVADTSRNDRTRNLSLYLEHPLLLAESGPPTVATALDFLEQTYVPLASAAWPYTTGFGFTAASDDQMKRFISEQTFAVKHFALSRPHAAPQARFASAWAPNNTCGGKSCIDPKLFAQLTDGILERLASSIHYAYEQGGASQAGACGPPGDHSWCSADIPGAAFNPLWLTFPDWN